MTTREPQRLPLREVIAVEIELDAERREERTRAPTHLICVQSPVGRSDVVQGQNRELELGVQGMLREVLG